jgi:hypothetical protein
MNAAGQVVLPTAGGIAAAILAKVRDAGRKSEV